SLVADALEQLQPRIRPAQPQRLGEPGDVHLLLALGERDHRHLLHAEPRERRERGVELAAAAVDQDQVRKLARLLELSPVAALDRLLDRAEIVGAGQPPQIEAPVVTLAQAPLAPD